MAVRSADSQGAGTAQSESRVQKSWTLQSFDENLRNAPPWNRNRKWIGAGGARCSITFE